WPRCDVGRDLCNTIITHDVACHANSPGLNQMLLKQRLFRSEPSARRVGDVVGRNVHRRHLTASATGRDPDPVAHPLLPEVLAGRWPEARFVPALPSTFARMICIASA